MPKILDACCGAKMFWFDRENPDVVYMDERRLETTLCDGRTLIIEPDVVGDFRQMPFPDGTFSLVVFDPPHLVKAGAKSWLALKYGVLGNDWREDLRKGFAECFRVLRPDGVLVFKWSEAQVPLKEILPLVGHKPLFGERRSRKHWIVFMKGDDK
ncbi:MAG: class I SAM-dependent methyltransferase [Synergistes jonesii]|uniref:class I SAM-dependent methyltransferase n=1 Tax=Synergistes jonesii TaxID=2754 RepID=UPI002A752E9A|nr:class I SAM-dependent methyltransferase [Synergistes jonesii]MDY2985903.1 class I SAM-dependent methyltransferase [Synergistes jonesii]